MLCSRSRIPGVVKGMVRRPSGIRDRQVRRDVTVAADTWKMLAGNFVIGMQQEWASGRIVLTVRVKDHFPITGWRGGGGYVLICVALCD